jgi:phosphoglycerol transferase MdoB-like AlkP superfamily enzyme
MNFLKNQTRNVRLSYRLFFIQFFILFLYRVVFSIIFAKDAAAYSSEDFFYAFFLGVKFDLRLSAALGLLILLTALIFFKKKNRLNKFMSQLFVGAELALLIFYIFDFGHYFYLESRMTSAFLQMAQNPLTSAQMMWQSYPIIQIVLLIVGLTYIFNKLFKHLIFFSDLNLKHSYPLTIWRKLGSWSLAVVFYAFLIYGKVSWYPLRWSEAFFTSNNYLTALALNPVLYYIDTMKFKSDASFKEKDFLQSKSYVDNYLGINTSSSATNFLRVEEATLDKTARPNIVVIVLESQAAFKTGVMGSTVDPTPSLDKLASESLLFTKFFVPTQATARSMFTLVTGIPDLSVEKTGSRNPFLVDQQSIINEFKEYQKLYLIGGSANWGNIRGIFTHNIDNLSLYEEEHFTSPRMDVWGISDYHLFIEANKVLKEKTGPFLAVIQTAGFHRPYTIPVERGSFVPLEKVSQEELQKNGFDSLEELNSLRWQDYGLGHFFELARKEKYYEDTIFVVYGDHGLPVQNAQHVPAGERQHNFENFHVPLILHSPKYFPSGRNDKMTSQLDLWPTLASFVGIPYRNTTLGRNVFDPKFESRDEAFVYFWYTYPPQFGVLTSKFFLKEDLDSISYLYDYTGSEPSKDVKEQFPEEYKRLRDLSLGLYYSSHYLMRNNKKIKN